MEIIDEELLDSITIQAIESPRLRMNYNFHESSDSKSQRLLNAMEPGTALPIHRHLNTPETYIVLRGSLNVLLYSENKEIVSCTEVNPKKSVFGANIPAGQWHTIEVIEPGTVIFEVKDGPYRSLTDDDILVIG
ncbi:MAG: WbuC family cupin fold metalloprotein [Paludibacter sp.]|nr:WbuC family cupin fold metalloprotein [Paludibacter sp.]